MRMRLRAPDEPEAENGYEFGNANTSAPSTPEHTHLPPLDVGSPEYIEERLENLKRRPNWNDYLDQYVEDHPDSDSEDGDFDDISRDGNAGFIRSTLWSLLVVTFAPLLILIAPCLKHKSYGFWPLGCRSMKELFNCALANVIFMVFGLVLLYWTICRELPDVFNLNNTLVKLNVQVDEFQRAVDTCHAALLQWERMVAQELCMPVGIDVALLLLNALLLLHYYRKWARYLMVIMAVMFVVDVPTQLYDATFPSPEIYQVDPTFAMVDEELLVALDGKNLKPGGSVAWVAYWGCATTSNVDACDKQFASTFEAGNVAVTFKSLDHFIPCYRGPPNPLKAQDYQCFENIRIRVKDMQSIPGWSRTAPQAAVEFQTIKTESTLNEEWDNVEAQSFKHEERIDHNTVNTEPREIESSLSTVNIDNALAAGSSSKSYPDGSTEDPGLKKNTATLSEERDAQENVNAPGSSLEAYNTGVVIIGEDMEEAEVMPDAVVKMRDIGGELQNELHIDEYDMAPVEEFLEELARKVEGSRASSETGAEAEMDKPKKHEENTPGYNIEDPYLSRGELRLEDTIVNEEILIIDEELSSMVVVEDEDCVQGVLNSDRDLELATEVERHTQQSTIEAQSGEVASRATTTQVEEELEPATEVEKHTASRTLESGSAGIVEEDEDFTQNAEPSVYEPQPEELRTSAAITTEEEVELATKVEKYPEPEQSTHEARPDEVRRSAVLTQEDEELEFATEMEKQSTFEAQLDDVNEEMELTDEGEEHIERRTFDTQPEEVSKSTATVKEKEDLELATEMEKQSKFEAQSDEVSTTATSAQEEELDLATKMEEQSMFEAQSDEVNEEMELTAEGEKHTERSTFDTQLGEASRSTATVHEEEELNLMEEVEKHPESATYDAQLDGAGTTAATAQKEDLTISSPKELLNIQEDTTSPAKKALSKLSEALSKLSDSSGFASAPKTISKKQKQSTRQGPRSRHTKKNAEPAAAENTAVV